MSDGAGNKGTPPRVTVDEPPTLLALADLKAAPYNAQRMTAREKKGLAESIRRYGFLQPIVVNRRGADWPETDRGFYIVGGHQRSEAARNVGLTHVPCYVIVLSPAAEKELNLALNNHGELDVVILGGLLGELQGIGMDLEPLGMGADEMAKAMRYHAKDAAGINTDLVPDLPAKPRTQAGEVLTLGRHRVICGDCTDPAVAKAALEGVTAWTVLTDPPYGARLENDYTAGGFRRTAKTHGRSAMGGRKYQRTQGDDKPFEPKPVFDLYGTKSMFLFGAEYYLRRIPESAGDGSWIAWDKRSDKGEGGVGSHFELIWSRQKRQRILLRHVWSGAFVAGGTSRKEAVNRPHPNIKPTALLRDILARWTKPGDVIVDPYLGSGSTLIACEQIGRTCIGVEILPVYCDVTRQRFEAMVPQAKAS